MADAVDRLTAEVRCGAYEAELARIRGDMAHWRSQGAWYDRERVVRAVGRFVVEPAAIAAAKGGGWFRVFGAETRAAVAEGVVRGWELARERSERGV